MAKILFLTFLLIAVWTVPSQSTENVTTTATSEGTSENTVTPPSAATTDATNSSTAEVTSGATDPSTATVPTGSTTPSTATTQAASGSTISAGTDPTGGTTISPGTGSSATLDPTGTTAAPTTTPPSPCATNPCPSGSTCDDRYGQTYTCLCLPGDVYENNKCQRASVFPALLKLEKAYVDAMSNKTSKAFNDTAKEITDEMDKKFKDVKNGYSHSVVLELRRSLQSKARSETGKVEASVEIIYNVDADIKTEDVETAIKQVVCNEGCTLKGEVETKGICDSKPCDAVSTTCKDIVGSFICECNSDYYKHPLSDRVCVVCPPGQKYDSEKNTCVNCSPLLTGVNCKDNTALILVIVVSIVGALLIIALIVLPIVLSKNKKKKSKKGEDILEPYYSHSVAKAPASNGSGFGYGPSVKESAYNLSANTGAPRIPRATHTSNWDKTNLEMTPSNSRQNLIPSGRNSNNPYDHVVQRSNPYGQSGGMNPYSQNRGQTNPYFN